ncbi:MAG TPA: hypothetical protein VHQ41_01955 [Patescibacteria group bacterium]|jgi:hypothetical protein|nr:hypothetical protein [Patescibacteria group bacterium]
MTNEELLEVHKNKVKSAERFWALSAILFAIALAFVEDITYWGVILVTLMCVVTGLLVYAFSYLPASMAIESLKIHEWYKKLPVEMKSPRYYSSEDLVVIEMLCAQAAQYGMICGEPNRLNNGSWRVSVQRA